MNSGMRALTAIGIATIVTMASGSAHAIPKLQLYIENGFYDSTTETWIGPDPNKAGVNTDKLVLWVIGNPNKGEIYDAAGNVVSSAEGGLLDVRLAISFDAPDDGSVGLDIRPTGDHAGASTTANGTPGSGSFNGFADSFAAGDPDGAGTNFGTEPAITPRAQILTRDDADHTSTTKVEVHGDPNGDGIATVVVDDATNGRDNPIMETLTIKNASLDANGDGSADVDSRLPGGGGPLDVLPSHGVFPEGRQWQEYSLGNFILDNVALADFQPDAGDDPLTFVPSPTSGITCPPVANKDKPCGQINVYSIDISQFTGVSGWHFDVYGIFDKDKDNAISAGDMTVFAPFSHDAGGTQVPEPVTFALLATGLAGLAGLSRRRR